MAKAPLVTVVSCFVFSLFLFGMNSTKSIPVAAIFAVTGPAAPSNVQSITGVRLAVDAINRQGGVFGRPLELKIFDNQSTPIGSKVAAEDAIEQGVVAILGADWSSHSLAVAKVAQSKGIPMISTISTNPQVTRTGDSVFRVCFTDELQGKVMARFARQDLLASTAAVFVDISSDYSLGLSQSYIKYFKALGGKIVAAPHYKNTWRDYQSIVESVLPYNPDVLFFAGYTETGRIAQLCREAGLQGAFLSGDGWTPEAFHMQWADVIRLGYYCDHWNRNSDAPASKAFVEKYAQTQTLNSQVALAFDAASLLVDAMKRAGSTQPAAVRKALSETRNFQGITGNISFDEAGDPIKDAHVIRICNGTVEYYKTVESIPAGH